MTGLTPLVWCVVAFGLLLGTQRWFQTQLQRFLVALTRDARLTVILYALLFAPGAALHEVSHWLAAKVLGVRTVTFSLVPKEGPGDQLRLGYVETERTDPIRSALIGVAPLLSGVALLSLLTLSQLALEPVVGATVESEIGSVIRTVALLPAVPDVGLWLYLVVAVSNTMLPSAADRSAWLPAGLIVLSGVVVIVWSGLGLRGMGWLGAQTQGVLPKLSAVFGLTASLNLLLGLTLWGGGQIVLWARRLISD